MCLTIHFLEVVACVWRALHDPMLAHHGFTVEHGKAYLSATLTQAPAFKPTADPSAIPSEFVGQMTALVACWVNATRVAMIETCSRHGKQYAFFTMAAPSAQMHRKAGFGAPPCAPHGSDPAGQQLAPQGLC